MKKPLTVTLTAALALSMTLSGCGDSGDSGDGQVTLTMVESLTSPTRTTLLRDMLNDFEAENPNVKVELISPPMSSADQKIQQMLQTQQDADIVEVRDFTLATLTNNGWIVDIKDEMESWDSWDELTDAAKAAVRFEDGNIYMTPHGIYRKAMFYRTDLLEEAGFSGPPETWEELLEMGKKITDPAKNQFGFAFRGAAGGGQQFKPIIASYNGDNVSMDEPFKLKNGKSLFSSEESVEAARIYLEIFKEASPPSSVSWSYPEMVQGFTSGVAAILMQDPEVIPALDESEYGDKYAVTASPKGPSGFSVDRVGHGGWGLTSHTKHKVEALKLLEFLSSSAQSLRFSQTAQTVPVTKAAATDPAFDSPAWKGIIAIDSMPSTLVMPAGYDIAWYSEWRQKSDDDLSTFITGGFTPESLMKNWDDYWTEKWANS